MRSKLNVVIILGLTISFILIYLLVTVLITDRNHRKIVEKTPIIKPTETIILPSPTISLFQTTHEKLINKYKENIISAYSCVQSLKDERGTYSAERVCTLSNQSCKQLNNINTQGPAQIWMTYHIMKSYPDLYSSSLQNILKDLSAYKEIVPYQQNMSWNCLFFFDIYQDEDIPNNIKEMVKNQCLNVIMPQDYELFLDTEINNRKSDETSIVDLIINPELLNQNETTKFERLVLFSTEYAKRYAFTNDNQDKLRSLYSTALTMSQYESENQQIYLRDKCYIGQGLLSAYELTKDNRIFNLAKETYVKQNISNIALPQVNTRFADKVVCLYFVRSLIDYEKELNNEPLYNELTNVFETTTNRLFSEYQDLNGKSSYFNGDGCFNSATSNDVVIKSNQLNALVLGTIVN